MLMGARVVYSIYWKISQPQVWSVTVEGQKQKIAWTALRFSIFVLENSFLLELLTGWYVWSDDGVAVKVSNLVKVFRGADGQSNRAVDNVSMDFTRGCITALLGHNGAGKTTTINILTGMLQPTSGSAFIDGRNILTEMHQVGRSIFTSKWLRSKAKAWKACLSLLNLSTGAEHHLNMWTIVALKSASGLFFALNPFDLWFGFLRFSSLICPADVWFLL